MRLGYFFFAASMVFCISASGQAFFDESVVRDPEVTVKPGDIVLVNIAKILSSSSSSDSTIKRKVNPTIDRGNEPKVEGFPFVVLRNGTINLPAIGPVSIDGQSVLDVEKTIKQSYLDAKILRKDEAAVVVCKYVRTK